MACKSIGSQCGEVGFRTLATTYCCNVDPWQRHRGAFHLALINAQWQIQVDVSSRVAHSVRLSVSRSSGSNYFVRFAFSTNRSEQVKAKVSSESSPVRAARAPRALS